MRIRGAIAVGSARKRIEPWVENEIERESESEKLVRLIQRVFKETFRCVRSLYTGTCAHT